VEVEVAVPVRKTAKRAGLVKGERLRGVLSGRSRGVRGCATRGGIRVYLAGPAQSPAERRVMEELAGVVEGAGHETWLPFRDGIEDLYQGVLALGAAGGAAARVRDGAAAVVAQGVFALEVFQLVERCGCLLLNMDGRVPDEGAVFRAALAFTRGRPVVLYKRDLRAELHGHDNAMITGLSPGFRAVRTRDAIPGELEAMRCGEPPFHPPAGLSPAIERAVGAGRSIWRTVSEEGPFKAGGEGWDRFVEMLARECAALGSCG